MLDSIGGGVARLFCQLPAVLAFERTQQTLEIGERPPARFRPSKAPTDALSNAAQSLRPLLRFACGCPNLGHNCYLYALKVTTFLSTTVGLNYEQPHSIVLITTALCIRNQVVVIDEEELMTNRRAK